jgi:dipeptidyl aminopeptidase/acylaminoacyl peptidase
LPLEVEELMAIEMVRDARISPDGSRIASCALAIDAAADRTASTIQVRGLTGDVVDELEHSLPGRHPRWSPDGGSLAFIEDGDRQDKGLFLVTPGGDGPRSLCVLSAPGPPTWSPQGDRIALSVAGVDGSRRIAVVAIAHAEVQLLPSSPGTADDFPAWSPDGRLAFARETPGSPDGGPTSEIRVGGPEVHDATAVEAGLAFATCPSWSPDGATLACVGTRERRLGSFDPALRTWTLPAGGGVATEASADAVGVVLAPGPAGPVWSPDGATIIYRLADRGEIHLVAADLRAGASPRRLARRGQVVDFSTADDGTIALVELTADDPGSVRVIDPRVGEAGLAPVVHSPLPSRVIPTATHRPFGRAGRTLDAWLLGVDRSGGPQPLLLCLHGGPHGFFGPVLQLGHFYRHVLAARGWIVLCLNSTGSGSYGEEFADGIRAGWGEVDLPEHHDAVAELIGDGLVDEDRMAVAGYSYGGFLAAWAASHDPRFRVAVVGAPITDLARFATSSDIGSWYTPWEMKVGPTDFADRYDHFSPVARADRVSASILLLHGDADRRVPIEQSELLRERIAGAGSATVEIVRYEGADHLFYADGRPSQRLDFNRRIVDWIETHTEGGTRSDG